MAHTIKPMSWRGHHVASDGRPVIRRMLNRQERRDTREMLSLGCDPIPHALYQREALWSGVPRRKR